MQQVTERRDAVQEVVLAAVLRLRLPRPPQLLAATLQLRRLPLQPPLDKRGTLQADGVWDAVRKHCRGQKQ